MDKDFEHYPKPSFERVVADGVVGCVDPVVEFVENIALAAEIHEKVGVGEHLLQTFVADKHHR